MRSEVLKYSSWGGGGGPPNVCPGPLDQENTMTVLTRSHTHRSHIHKHTQKHIMHIAFLSLKVTVSRAPTLSALHCILV